PLIRAGEGRWQGRRQPGEGPHVPSAAAQYRAETGIWTALLTKLHRRGRSNGFGIGDGGSEDFLVAACDARRWSILNLHLRRVSGASAFPYCRPAPTPPQFGEISD